MLSASGGLSDKLSGSASLGDYWRPTPGVQVQYGLRLDANRFLSTPAFNQELLDTFGLRNSAVPNQVYLSPRVGVQWYYGSSPQVAYAPGAARPPRAVIHLGLGVFQNMAAVTDRSCVLTGAQETEADPCEVASSNLFSVLGSTPFRGRTFSSDEDMPEGAKVALLSYGLWHRRFGADENVIGHSIDINGSSYTVVGVMPANFSRLYSSPGNPLPEMWLSGIALSPANLWNDYFGIGRLKAGVSLSQAEERLDQLSLRLQQEQPGLKGWRAELAGFRDMLAGDTRPALLVLMGAVIFVLLIACA